ncbi:PREDICTED: uncharacterized protein LOC104544762 [Mesitornis unicolor]|uniref:uncharacterized protein LOC104544762 n=1 Tax=Mesitornis unicolor TaxID=54374 RepID=UPI0005284A51|nr:PREDICTED: uncharacterized protein LOC104544762 [Mesitornis unicolor]
MFVQSKHVRDGSCGDAHSLRTDLSSLVTWAHTHGTICNQIPALENVRSVGRPSRDNSVVWMCGVGHAYHWQCGTLRVTSRGEDEAAEKRTRLASSEASPREANLGEKRCRMTPSFESAKAGACSGSPGVTQQRDTAVYVTHNAPSPRENQNTSKPTKSRVAVERHLSVPGAEIKPDRHQVKLESSEDPQIISDDEQHVSHGDDQGDAIHQNTRSESLTKGVTGKADLEMCRSQKMAFAKPSATPVSGKPPLSLTCLPKSPVSNQERLDSSFLRLGPLAPARSVTEAARARNPSGSAIPERLKSDPVSDTEPPSSVMFFEFEATEVCFQQPLLLSAPEHDALKQQEKKRSHKNSAIKRFKDWLVLRCPPEMREVCQLPPQDLDRYLAAFYSSARRQNGAEFSAGSLQFFQGSIERYLKEHGYEHSVVKGLEFRASQKAWKLKYEYLSQREREAEWSFLENLTDEDVEGLCEKGFLSKTDPQGFLNLMFTNIIRAFGAITHSQSHHLYWGQLVLKSEGEQECLEWKHDLSTEGDTGELGPCLFAKPDSPGACLVADYKEYARRRPLDMLHDHDPLYLVPKPLCSIWDQVWYSRKALTKGKMEKTLKVIIQQVRASTKKSKK